jgi:dGTPase
MKFASYATLPENSLGRLVKEPLDNQCYLADRERLIHSLAFRRLEYKTQVFINYLGDHYRTRLTHTLEVAQNARVIARRIGLNEDLAEVVALSHDLGHPPFGHAGEDGLNLAAKKYGGFDHNNHTIKIITLLESRHAGFNGLNLTWETLEGCLNHNGPLGLKGKKKLPSYITSLARDFDISLTSQASLEAQVAAVADDIAYCNHDIDDGVRADFFALEELEFIEPIRDIIATLKKQYPQIAYPQLVFETTKALKNLMIDDVVKNAKALIKKHDIKTSAEVRQINEPLVCFSKEINAVRLELMKFLIANVYRNYRVNRMTIKAKSIVHDLFTRLMESPNCLPKEWYKLVKGQSEKVAARHILDYIAGMTDRFAIEEHKNLFDPLKHD